MFQKYAPLIILAMFAVAVYFMVDGMQRAHRMSHPAPVHSAR